MANISSYAQSFHTSPKREGLLEKVVEQTSLLDDIKRKNSLSSFKLCFVNLF